LVATLALRYMHIKSKMRLLRHPFSEGTTTVRIN
jgi:hypothetical protein